MVEHEVVTTDAQIEAALKRARGHDGEPRAQTVEHVPKLNLLIVGLSNGRRLVLPVEDVQGLGLATHEQIQNYELLGRGSGIHFPELDVDLYIPALIEGVYGNRLWMAQLGKKGGAARTEAKRLAAQANGAKGGRPKKITTEERTSISNHRLASKPKTNGYRLGQSTASTPSTPKNLQRTAKRGLAKHP
jgi:hypothetical protein